MSHGIFGDRFYGRYNAWHELGTVSEEDTDASQAFTTVGPYDVELRQLYFKSDGELIEVPNRAIIRTPVPDDPEERFFGTVGSEYELIPPWDVCQLWDEYVRRRVDTLGVLQLGKQLFITTKLPDFDVKGDPIENFLALISPYTGLEAYQGRITSTRIVCQNTLEQAKQNTTELYKVPHTDRARKYLGEWLEHIYDRALARAELLKLQFELFSDTPVVAAQLDDLLQKMYPSPKEPAKDLPPTQSLAAEKTYVEGERLAVRSRAAVAELFNGRGTGMDLPSTLGTMFGLWNAAVEWEDWRPSNNKQLQAQGQLFGDRSAAKVRVYNALNSVVVTR